MMPVWRRAVPTTFYFSGRRRLADEAGAETLEAALVLPLLLTLLIGIVWIGRAYNIWQTMTRAAREGARYAVLPSCASCGNSYVDTYTALNTCLTNPTNVFTNFVSPALSASALDPKAVQNYCQQAVVLNPNTNITTQQCGVAINFTYPVKLVIPFTSLNATTINISTQVRMRMENQAVDNIQGNPQCP